MRAFEFNRVSKNLYFMSVISIFLLAQYFAEQVLQRGAIFSLYSAITASLTFAYFIPTVVNRWLWFRWPLRLILNIPDLRGRWIGWVADQRNKEWRAFAIELVQFGPSLQMTIFSSTGAIAHSHSSSIRIDEGRGCVIFLISEVETNDPQDPSSKHDATHKLRLYNHQETKMLRGDYFNNRILKQTIEVNGKQEQRRGNYGKIQLHWKCGDLAEELAFDKSDWPNRPTSYAPDLVKVAEPRG